MQGVSTSRPMLAGVIVLGAALGVAIAGWPRSGDDVRIRPAQPVAAPLDTTPFPASTAAPATDPSVTDPSGSDPSGSEVTVLPASSAVDTSEPKVASLPAPATTAVASSSTTATPTTVVPTTTGTTTGTTPVDTAPATAPPATVLPPGLTAVPREQVRVVLANGDGRYNLVGRNVDRLLPLGYVTIDQTDLAGRVDRTIIYYRDGFFVEAVRLAGDLLVPDAVVEPLGTLTITSADDRGDLIAVLGPDAVR